MILLSKSYTAHSEKNHPLRTTTRKAMNPTEGMLCIVPCVAHLYCNIYTQPRIHKEKV